MKQQQKFYFGGAFYLQVLQGLCRTLSELNVALLLGESGVGKSSLCDKLRQYLVRQNEPVLLLNEPPSSPEILRSIIARELDLPDSASLAVLLPDALLSRSDDGGFKPLTLILDDAHLLSDVTLMELAHLSVARVNDKPALRLLLSSEAALAERLAKRPDLKGLWQVINEGTSAPYQLEPMRSENLQDFLQGYLRHTGRAEEKLSDESIQRLYKSCHGYPGQALKLAAELKQEDFIQMSPSYSAVTPDAGVVLNQQSEQGSAEISGGRMQSWLAGMEHRQTRALLPVAAVVVLSSLGFVYQQLKGSDDQASVGSTVDAGPQQVASAPLEDDSQQSTDAPAAEIDTAVSPFVDAPMVDEVDDPAPEPPMSEEQLNREALLAAIERARVAAQVLLASDQPVSDSGLVLVTAAERGISEDSFALPDIESLLAAEQDDPVSQSAPEQTAVERVEATEATEAAEEIEDGDPGEAQVALQTPQQAIPEGETTAVADADIADIVTPVEPQPRAAEEEADSENTWQDRVAGWVSAWQKQDLDAYFEYYHDRFVPRYQNSLSAWRSNRERVIGGATGIELQMFDFDVISESQDEVEVHFWLDYRSPSYQDQTRKKIVLAPYEGSWLIIEEVNLEVRV